MSIELENIDSLIDKLDKLASDEQLKVALGKACAIVERAAKEKAPKGSGELRRSIESRVENGQGIVFTPLEYAPYVEYGTGLFAEGGNGRKEVPWSYQDEKGEWHSTVGMHPMPFLRPALNENRENILRILKDGLIDG